MKFSIFVVFLFPCFLFSQEFILDTIPRNYEDRIEELKLLINKNPQDYESIEDLANYLDPWIEENSAFLRGFIDRISPRKVNSSKYYLLKIDFFKHKLNREDEIKILKEGLSKFPFDIKLNSRLA